MTGATVPTGAAAPPADPPDRPASLTPEQVQAIEHARRQGRKVSRAATVAAFSGWTLAVFAFLSLLGGLFSPVSLVLGAGLGVVAYVELKGAAGLRRLDAAAPRRLGFNQIALGAMVILYCGWGLWQAVAGPGPYDSYLAEGGATAEMVKPISDLHKAITSAFYACLIVASAVAQGCTSLYYFTRRRHLDRFVRQTPAWVVETLRLTAP